MNFGDRYCVKTRWIFKTWWKPGEISRPGQNLVHVQNLVKTWWIFKTWWEPGEFSKLGENLVISLLWTRRSVLQIPNSPKEVFWAYFLVKIMCFHGENGSKISLDQNLVKTWWIFKTWWKPDELSKPGENLVKTWWKLGENLVKTRCKLGENLVKAWWKLGENSVKTWWKLGENLVKTCVNFENLVKTWWKPGENSVKTWWKLGENLVNFQNLVKTWWKPGQKSGRNLFENLVQPGENFLKKPRENLVKTWWKPCEFSQPGDNLMKCHNLGRNLMEF